MEKSEGENSAQSALVLLAVSGTDASGPLAKRLAREGSKVALLSDTEIKAQPPVVQIEISFKSRDSVAAGFRAVQQRLGVAQMVVHSATPAVSFRSAQIEGLSYHRWVEATHAAVTATIFCLQAAHEHFDGRGGSIVVFGPSFSLIGAPGLVPLSTTLEAQRALVKSAARQWGNKGIRVNWVAVGAETNYPALEEAAIPQVIELGPPPPPLGRVPDFGGDVALLIGFLGSDAARAITGATISVDGGNWMVP